MPVSYKKNLSKGYVHCKMKGVGLVEEVLGYINKLSADPDLDEPFFEIVDFTEATKLEFGYYESNRLMQKYLELGKNKGYRGTVFITGSDFSKGISNQFQTTGEYRGLNIQVADSLEDAERIIAMELDAGDPAEEENPG